MGNFLKGIEYPIFAGVGALLMLFTASPCLALLALIFPALWAWVFVPVAIGALFGLIVAFFIE